MLSMKTTIIFLLGCTNVGKGMNIISIINPLNNVSDCDLLQSILTLFKLSIPEVIVLPFFSIST
ncbi:hypothetical protein ED28_16560 [[Pantoea] beijingensis]|uniref:Uncharacterized protein n=1 Tax=[Pantoea] beijingensis TaxID=1324864 RepID=A0A443IAP5_9GAMM|nr:hypothetical protein ED28_16560 [[Pantoea] beijingensis]